MQLPETNASAHANARAVHLDHIGFIVRDLEQVAMLISQLGFCQTRRADHTRTDSRGAVVSAGSAQRSVMLHNGYIEFMQITDPLAGHQLTPALAVRHGLHVLALGSNDAAACRAALASAGVALGPLLHWSRQIYDADCQGEARFCYFDSRWEAHDPSYICWVQHLTPELMRPPHLLQHDNQSLGLSALVYRGPQPLAEAWVAQLLASGAQQALPRAGGVDVVYPNARISVEFDSALQRVLPSAIGLTLQDTRWLRTRCARLGLPLRELDGGAFALDLQQQLGVDWIFRPAPGRTP